MNLSEILRIFLLDSITKYNFFVKHFTSSIIMQSISMEKQGTINLCEILHVFLLESITNINAGHKVESVSGDISGNNATLYLHMHHLSLSGMCVIAG